MLKLTKKADYRLMAMKHLAERTHAGACRAKDVADSYGLPQEALAKIPQRLVKSGLLPARHGINGGYRLAPDARTISAFGVIRAIDGPLFVTSCATVRGTCGQTERCTVRQPLRKVSSSSIEDLLKEHQDFTVERSPTRWNSKEAAPAGHARRVVIEAGEQL